MTKKKSSAQYYRENSESRKNKSDYDKEYQKKNSAVKKRVECNKANRDAGTYGNGDGKDASHTSNGEIVMEDASTNRARKGLKLVSAAKGSRLRKKKNKGVRVLKKKK